MKQILGTFSFLILIVTILIALVSNYIVDVRGITLEGIYECHAKRMENIPLKVGMTFISMTSVISIAIVTTTAGYIIYPAVPAD